LDELRTPVVPGAQDSWGVPDLIAEVWVSPEKSLLFADLRRVTRHATAGLSVLGAINQLDIAGNVLSDADIVVVYGSPEGIYPGMSALMNRGER
jgi:hypothetical protein